MVRIRLQLVSRALARGPNDTERDARGALGVFRCLQGSREPVGLDAQPTEPCELDRMEDTSDVNMMKINSFGMSDADYDEFFWPFFSDILHPVFASPQIYQLFV